MAERHLYTQTHRAAALGLPPASPSESDDGIHQNGASRHDTEVTAAFSATSTAGTLDTGIHEPPPENVIQKVVIVISSDEEEEEEEEPHCPLCVEPLDETEKQFRPCPCGYQVCLFCYDRLKLELKGLCPSCRTPYGSAHPSQSRLTAERIATEALRAAQAAAPAPPPAPSRSHFASANGDTPHSSAAMHTHTHSGHTQPVDRSEPESKGRGFQPETANNGRMWPPNSSQPISGMADYLNGRHPSMSISGGPLERTSSEDSTARRPSQDGNAWGVQQRSSTSNAAPHAAWGLRPPAGAPPLR
eukprot:CAMPEP_0198205246 /NCGR_PEP_ID=MMETSP1445-20131203/8757_1 /TAXON_ID=36898 /ORGANISM="Pyramimonas sp., Strain CCMP2087" /LENGTH=301 /DNA_ID=CAMNT_0043877475 /DNA_START=591 /DNA_END=1492 /DNA_ORIENTATION=+